MFIPPPLPSSFASLNILAPKGVTPPLQQLLILEVSGSPSLIDSCEDQVEWRTRDRTLVILSCDPSRTGWNTVMGSFKDPTPRGALWLVDPEEENPGGRILDLVGFPPESNFHPLGIDVFSSTGDVDDTLFVVNHQHYVSTIEVFKLSQSSPTKARYVRTLSHPSFTGAPNSIAALSPTSFYLTHDHRFNKRGTTFIPKLLNALETYLALAQGRVDVVSFTENGSTATINIRTVVDKIAFANGMTLSRSGETVAVASTTAWSILLYSRNPVTNELKFKERIDVPFLIDNLSTAPDEFLGVAGPVPDIFIATGHPNFFSLAARAQNKTVGSYGRHPLSWVVAVHPRNSTFQGQDNQAIVGSYTRAKPSPNWALSTVFQSNGNVLVDEKAFGSSSTGVVGRTRDGRKWLVVTGLYARGANFFRELTLET